MKHKTTKKAAPEHAAQWRRLTDHISAMEARLRAAEDPAVLYEQALDYALSWLTDWINDESKPPNTYAVDTWYAYESVIKHASRLVEAGKAAAEAIEKIRQEQAQGARP